MKIKKDLHSAIEKKEILTELKADPIDQIKNVAQEKKRINLRLKQKLKLKKKILIDSLDQLLKVCSQNKEIKLRYEIEKNVNLVSFEKNRIEISFNDNLDKYFVKDLSSKLFDWTSEKMDYNIQ